MVAGNRQIWISRGQPEVLPPGASQPAYDARFRRLLPASDWAQLPELVRRRFSKRLGASQTALYKGRVVETRHSRLGWMLAQVCRVIGAPLPLYRDNDVPAVVSVSEDAQSGGQCWTRIYGRRDGFPQVIHSAKRFAGPTGLEEYLGRKLGMALSVSTEANELVFRSAHYFLMLFGRRVKLPHWMGPGRTMVRHRDLGEGRFAFDLDVIHPLFGELVHQHAEFQDV
ncbi:DUF4166 domain-containing protein [Altererythrobacter luteolus]|uniref:DUF4166 domain-containing protein n=1 Tax=Pontixanthobacter luteolus TaxID=295089 RepID=A0A6I4V1M0_9SPHN|nr:DUF4166 domain-containing protein [Pontixanthobacter luteolus]